MISVRDRLEGYPEINIHTVGNAALDAAGVVGQGSPPRSSLPRPPLEGGPSSAPGFIGFTTILSHEISETFRSTSIWLPPFTGGLGGGCGGAHDAPGFMGFTTILSHEISETFSPTTIRLPPFMGGRGGGFG